MDAFETVHVWVMALGPSGSPDNETGLFRAHFNHTANLKEHKMQVDKNGYKK